MERRIVCVKLSDRVQNSTLRTKTKIVDVGQKDGCLLELAVLELLYIKRVVDRDHSAQETGMAQKEMARRVIFLYTILACSGIIRDEWKKGSEAFVL